MKKILKKIIDFLVIMWIIFMCENMFIKTAFGDKDEAFESTAMVFVAGLFVLFIIYLFNYVLKDWRNNK